MLQALAMRFELLTLMLSSMYDCYNHELCGYTQKIIHMQESHGVEGNSLGEWETVKSR